MYDPQNIQIKVFFHFLTPHPKITTLTSFILLWKLGFLLMLLTIYFIINFFVFALNRFLSSYIFFPKLTVDSVLWLTYYWLCVVVVVVVVCLWSTFSFSLFVILFQNSYFNWSKKETTLEKNGKYWAYITQKEKGLTGSE